MIMAMKNSDEEKFSLWEEMQAVHAVVRFVWLEASMYIHSWKVTSGLVRQSGLRVNRMEVWW